MRKEGHPSARPTHAGEPRLSRASVGRLSLYLRHLEGLLREGVQKVSSGQLGDGGGVGRAGGAGGGVSGGGGRDGGGGRPRPVELRPGGVAAAVPRAGGVGRSDGSVGTAGVPGAVERRRMTNPAAAARR